MLFVENNFFFFFFVRNCNVAHSCPLNKKLSSVCR